MPELTLPEVIPAPIHEQQSQMQAPTPESLPKVVPIILSPQAFPKVNMNKKNIHVISQKEADR